MNKYFSVYVLGAIAALSMPPFYLFPCLAIAYSGLFFRLGKCENSSGAFVTSWLFGLGFFMVSLYWICISLTVDIVRFGWLIPFTLIGLNGLIALFPAFAGWLFFKLRKKINVKFQPMVFALIFFASEYARGHLFTGFPWNLSGYTWAFSVITLQSTYFIGIYGLTFLTLIAAVLPAAYLNGSRKTATILLLFIAAVIFLPALRLVGAETKFVDGVTLNLVQPNIPQSQKWDEKQAYDNVRLLLDLSKNAKSGEVIIWPESAVPFLIGGDGEVERSIVQRLKPSQVLLTGAMRVNGDSVSNSLVALSANISAATYDKHHLVPFGEYVPFRNILPIEKIASGLGDIVPGGGAQTVLVGKLPPFSPLICYEAIFPGEVVADKNAKWLLTVTNDAWFGNSTGPYQHFAMARVRAVEEGLPLVRVANTGISAVIDSYGNVIASLPLGQQGTLISRLPKSLAE